MAATGAAMTLREGRRAFTVSGVLGRFVQLVRADPWTIGLLAGGLGAAPSLLFGVLRTTAVIPPLGDDLASMAVGQPVELLLNTLVGLLVQGALIGAAISGARRSLGARATAGLILPLFVIQLSVNLLVGLGLVIVIVPGLYLMARYAVAAPARVDRPGLDLGGALGRSADLTEGRRWKVLGACLLGLLLALLPTLLIVPASLAIPILSAHAFILEELLVAPLIQVMVVLLNSVGLAALYLELRAAKEGGAELAEVFA